MFSPIQGQEIEAEECSAHIIPAALGMSNTTVKSEREFDNTFGTLNDSELIRYVRNCVEDDKDFEISFYDETLTTQLNKTTIRAKSTVRHQANDLRSGQICLEHLGEHLKKHVGLGIGSTLMLRQYQPDVHEESRIGCSMLHSAYLTMYYHFGRAYVSHPDIKSIQAMIGAAVLDPLPPSLAEDARRSFYSSQFFFGAVAEASVSSIFKDSFSRTAHPVWRIDSNGLSCFAAVLNYHPKLVRVCLLPGFGGDQAINEWRGINELLIRRRKHLVNGRIVVYDPASGGDAEALWRARPKRN